MAAFTVIDHTELAGSAASWTEASIAASYDHLYLVLSTRTDQSAYQSNIYVNFNGDTGTNYSETQLYAGTATPASYRASGQTKLQYGAYATGASVLADTFSSTTMWIPNYANTANFKQTLTSSVSPNNSSTDSQWLVNTTAGLWGATPAAIHTILLTPVSGSFVQYSTFTLYGVTGA